jgi:hypothetical protein
MLLLKTKLRTNAISKVFKGITNLAFERELKVFYFERKRRRKKIFV